MQGVGATLEDALANPSGINHCAFERQIAQLIEGIDQAMAVPLADGTLEVRYRRGAPELGGALLTLMALLICLALALGRWPLPRRM